MNIKVLLNFEIAPVAMARPRFSTYGGKLRVYIPQRQHDFMDKIAEMARDVWSLRPIENTPLKVTAKFYRKIPKSFSKAKRQAIKSGQLRPISRPDTDNYLKILLDALTGICWKDDNLIVDMHCSKYYSDIPHIELLIEDLGGVVNE